MMENINLGIDLGTTNSGIGVYQDGKVALLKNPIGFQETLPSVVAFRGERILVGAKAKELLVSTPEIVFSSFKRKMGTSEKFELAGNGKMLSPIDLSAQVLKELRSFNVDAKKMEAAVITIPASFDTIQSNATKEAGYQAGFEEVILLQEPIAACLAYSNENNLENISEEKWLVYDFGGGTFDAALVKIDSRELKVIDHKGDNFLGGVDIDLALMKNLIIPKLEKETGQHDVWNRITSGIETTYGRLGKYLSYLCEELKKELSLKESAWIEINFSDLNIFTEFEVKRSEFNELVEPFYKDSLELVNELLSDNKLKSNDISRIVLVGGTTYIPYIRQKLGEDTAIQIDASIDPTTAIIKGAAFYAGTKPKSKTEATETPLENSPFEVNVSFDTMTQDEEELIAFAIPNGHDGFFRISRKDGGYDSGTTAFTNSGKVFVQVLPKQINRFQLQIFDAKQKLVYTKNDIEISHGFYNINGQPLPNDICLELDSEEETYLELIFKKNSILPLKKTLYKTFSRSILQGSADKIVLNVVEGKIGTMPGANMNIGYLEIKGTDLIDDLIKGTDIELSFEISESRDLKVELYIPSIDQEIKQNFNPESRGAISAEKTKEEIDRGLAQLNATMADFEQSENYEKLAELMKFRNELESIKSSIEASNEENFTDAKYQLQDKKRKILYSIDKMNLLDDLAELIEEYHRNKEYLEIKLDSMPPKLVKEFETTVKGESQFLQLQDKYLLKRKIEALEKIGNSIFFEREENYIQVFLILRTCEPEEFKDYKAVQKLFRDGEKEYEKNDYPKLKAICHLIMGQLKNERNPGSQFKGTGLK